MVVLSPLCLPNIANESRFDITPNGQQIHIAFGPPEPHSSRHPCFKLENAEKLEELKERIWSHFQKGGSAAALQTDEPGKGASGKSFVEARQVRLRPLMSVNRCKGCGIPDKILCKGLCW